MITGSKILPRLAKKCLFFNFKKLQVTCKCGSSSSGSELMKFFIPESERTFQRLKHETSKNRLKLHKTFKILTKLTCSHKKNGFDSTYKMIWIWSLFTNLSFWTLKQLLRKQLPVCIILKSEKLAKTTFYWRTNKSSY